MSPRLNIGLLNGNHITERSVCKYIHGWFPRERGVMTCSTPESSLGWHGAVQVPAGGDAQLGEHFAQVPFHGARADEQLRGDLGVGAPVPGQPDDVLLLRGELAVRADLAFADLLAGGGQLAPR